MFASLGRLPIAIVPAMARASPIYLGRRISYRSAQDYHNVRSAEYERELDALVFQHLCADAGVSLLSNPMCVLRLSAIEISPSRGSKSTRLSGKEML
jgi:hypothetical protein